jgi:hypothetical protein
LEIPLGQQPNYTDCRLNRIAKHNRKDEPAVKKNRSTLKDYFKRRAVGSVVPTMRTPTLAVSSLLAAI